MGRKDSVPEDAPAPRLCSLVKWPYFTGYGFNLHTEKGKEGQFIGKIDAGSPAEACGLLDGDQIIEVNGVNTSNENHRQVVERIKADAARVQLLVVDQAAADYYRRRDLVVRGSMENVRQMRAVAAGQDQETGEAETGSQGDKSEASDKTAEQQANGNKHGSPHIDTTLQVESAGSERAQPSPAPSSGSTGTVESGKSAESTTTSGGGGDAMADRFGLKLNMSAAEMREYLKSKKRHDPRNDNLSFKRRHEIVSNM